MLNQADLTTAQLDSLGTPVGHTPVSYGSAHNGIVDMGNLYLARVNFGDNIITEQEIIAVVYQATQTVNGVVNTNFTLASQPEILGIGSNAPTDWTQSTDGFPESVTAFLPGALEDGELINLPAVSRSRSQPAPRH